MKKTLLILTFLSLVHSVYSIDRQLDSLLNVLDNAIKERHIYVNKKKDFIKELENQAANTDRNEARFFIYGRLFEEYKNFQMDSALCISNRRLQIANILNNKEYQTTAQMNMAEVMIVTGLYKDALDILQSQDKAGFNNDQIAYIYHLYHSLYMLMAEYSISEEERDYYLNLEYQYKDSILSIIPQSNSAYQLVECSKLMMEGNYQKALAIADQTYEKYKDNTRIVAMLAFTVSNIHFSMGDSLKGKKSLAISAIDDMRSGVKEYTSLPRLAELLYEEGVVDRAYNYIKCSMEDAIYCKARLRTIEMSRMLPIINSAYDVKMKQERDNLILFLIIILILVCVLVISLIYIYKQLKALAVARRSLKEINQHLKQMNEDLNGLNIELSESNHVKEEYIGYVFNMCSTYIDKLDDFRKKVNQKLTAGQTESLYKQTSSSSFVSDELKEFYKSFDSIFLNIYPNFIRDFNNLLQDKEHISPKEGELLSPELRIYALVRLGINDSVKIASFLHYSPQTVYNYRLKVRNKAKVSDKFPDLVRQLGQRK